MSLDLLTRVQDAKWAIMPNSLEAIVEIVKDHKHISDRANFHGAQEELKSEIATIGTRIDGTTFSSQEGNVGILTVDGPIIPRSVETMSSGPSASLERFSNELRRMDADESIDTIVISMDSPGGMVTGVTDFAKTINSLKTPVDGFVYGYCASACYWFGSQVRNLYVSSTAELGSIGTVAIFEDRSEADAEAGIKRLEVVSNLSPNKRLGPDTDAGKAALMKTLDGITEIFVQDVANGRGVSTEKVMESFGQGLMFLGQEAVDRGMADGVTTLSSLVNDLNSNSTTNTTRGGLIMSDTNKDVILTAEDLKTKHSSVYAEIFEAGVKAEQERLQSIESLVEKDPSVASFVNSKKFESGMTQAGMALAIFEAKDEIFKSAATANKNAGADLADKLENVPAADSEPTPNASEEDSDAEERRANLKKGAQQLIAQQGLNKETK